MEMLQNTKVSAANINAIDSDDNTSAFFLACDKGLAAVTLEMLQNTKVSAANINAIFSDDNTIQAKWETEC